MKTVVVAVAVAMMTTVVTMTTIVVIMTVITTVAITTAIIVAITTVIIMTAIIVIMIVITIVIIADITAVVAERDVSSDADRTDLDPVVELVAEVLIPSHAETFTLQIEHQSFKKTHQLSLTPEVTDVVAETVMLL